MLFICLTVGPQLTADVQNSGAAYIRSTGFEEKLNPSDPEESGQVGTSVDIDGNRNGKWPGGCRGGVRFLNHQR